MKTDSTGTAGVDYTHNYQPIDENTPRGQLLILICKADGRAVISTYNPSHGFDHYALMPTFKKEPPCENPAASQPSRPV